MMMNVSYHILKWYFYQEFTGHFSTILVDCCSAVLIPMFAHMCSASDPKRQTLFLHPVPLSELKKKEAHDNQ